MHKNEGWRGQLKRVHRWHQRLIYAADTGSEDLEDFAFAFFQNCFYIKEWMQKTSEIPQAEVNGFFSCTQELRICRDICNGTKHLTIDRPSVDADFSIGREYDPNSPRGYRLFIIADEKHDLLKLASRCIQLLDEFTGVKTP